MPACFFELCHPNPRSSSPASSARTRQGAAQPPFTACAQKEGKAAICMQECCSILNCCRSGEQTSFCLCVDVWLWVRAWHSPGSCLVANSSAAAIWGDGQLLHQSKSTRGMLESRNKWPGVPGWPADPTNTQLVHDGRGCAGNSCSSHHSSACTPS